jgi:hypothetical protein
MDHPTSLYRGKNADGNSLTRQKKKKKEEKREKRKKKRKQSLSATIKNKETT